MLPSKIGDHECSPRRPLPRNIGRIGRVSKRPGNGRRKRFCSPVASRFSAPRPGGSAMRLALHLRGVPLADRLPNVKFRLSLCYQYLAKILPNAL
jgi:hypothetical protein